MADAIEDDLSDRALAGVAFLAGLVIDGAGQAIERLGACLDAGRAERKGPRGTGDRG